MEKEFVNKEDLEETLQEYKKFAFKSDMIKLAVAFILGVAFDGVVKSISSNLIMPFVNYFVLQTAGGNWREAVYTPITGMTFEIGKATGSFFDFILISIILFFMLRWLGKHSGE